MEEFSFTPNAGLSSETYGTMQRDVIGYWYTQCWNVGLAYGGTDTVSWRICLNLGTKYSVTAATNTTASSCFASFDFP
jgi:hypothetical protein